MSKLAPVSLDRVRMRVVSTAKRGAVGAGTVFTFRQRGRMVTARYAGGRIAAGFLAGVWEKARLRFRYVQVDENERVDSGRSVAVVAPSPRGRLRLRERFTWESRPGTGTNVFEEI